MASSKCAPTTWNKNPLYILVAVFLLHSIPIELSAQRVLLSDPGRTYNDTDGPTLDIYGPVNVTTCTSVEFSLDYNFSLPWEGSGNMETSDECAFGVPPCAGNPRSPLGPCANCWDFLWAEFFIDGGTAGEGLIGEAGTTNSEQAGSISLIQCTNGNSATASMNITTQTWAANEAVTFSSLMILCYEGLPTASANPNPVCSNEILSLNGRITDPGVVSNHEWTGPGNIDDPFSLNTTVTDLPPGPAIFTLTTTDVNGCTGTDQVTVTVHPTPTAFPGGPLTACSSMGGQADFDLTSLNLTISGGGPDPVMWYRDIGLGSLIGNPMMFRTGSTKVYAVVDNGFCQSDVIEVDLIVLDQPTARPHTLEKCEEVAGTGRATFDLSTIDDIISSGQSGVTVSYFSDPMGLAPLPNPFNTGTTIIYARVDNGECKSAIVEVRIFVYPQPLGKMFSGKFCESEPGSGVLEIDLNDLNDSIRLTSSDDIEWFEDIFLSVEASDPYMAQIGVNVLYVQLDNGQCESDPIQVTIEILPTPTIASSELAVCEEPPGSGRGYFDLDSIVDLVLQGQLNTTVTFYADMNGNTEFNTPYNGPDTIIYARADNGECVSDIKPIVLKTIQPPTAKAYADTVCADSLDWGYFHPEDWPFYIANDTAIEEVQLAYDSLFTQPFGSPLFTRDTFVYARILNGACPSDWVIVRLTVLPSPQLDELGDTTVCDSFLLPMISGTDLGTDTRYSTTKDGGGTTFVPGDVIRQDQWLYVYSANGECTDVDSMNIIIQDGLQAGPDDVINVCEGAMVDLTNFLNNADPGGVFLDDSLSGALLGNMFNSSGFAGRRLSFRYALSPLGSCGGDTSVIYVDVVQEVAAGLDTMVQICFGDSINLNDILREADAGGSFVEMGMNNHVVNDRFLSELSGEGRFTIEYQIGDGVVCPMESAVLDIDVISGPVIDAISDVAECGYFVLPMISGSNVGSSNYFDGPSGTGNAYRAGDTIKTDITLYAFGAIGQCSDEEAFNIEIILPATRDISSMVCAEDSVTVGNEVFDINRRSGRVILSNAAQNGCDSIVTIDLTFRPALIEDFIGNYCGDTSFLINGNTYDRTNPVGQELLKNASINGCDSLVNINLTFINSVRDIDTTLCEGGFIEVNGTIYDENLVSGQEVLAGLGQSGCDSVVNIDITFRPSAKGLIESTYCGDEFVLIGGQRYDRTNPSGRDTLPGASALGCDSIIEIDLTFLDARDSMFNEIICATDTLEINGKRYFFGQSTGRDTLTNGASTGCDSIIVVQLDFLEGARLELSDTLCPEDFIIVNQVRYDVNNPSGSYSIPGGAANGCDSLVVVNLNFENYSLSPLISEYEISTGESVSIQFSTDLPYSTISWSDTNGVSCLDCLNPTISPAATGTYVVTFIDENGCQLTATILIKVIINRNVFVPNSFSPNGDNINDRIMLFAKDGVINEIKGFRIFDRWGELLYAEANTSPADGTHIGWDGVFNGEIMDPAVFVVQAEVELSSGELLNLSGSLTLLR